jgi:hypothetical protein
VTDKPTVEQIEKWEAVARGQVRLLEVIADVLVNGEGASSDYLRQKAGLSMEEWHGAGQLIAAATVFCAEKGFLEWHAKGMV